MNTNILNNGMGKQILGACAGMAIAGVIYVGVTQMSDANIKGLLVSTKTVTENAGQVSINDQNVDEATMRRITGRALEVANQLANASSSAAAVTPMNERAIARGEQRQFATQVKQNFSSAPTYSNNPNKVMTEEERNAIRAANLHPQFTQATPVTISPLTFNNPSETAASIVDVPQGDDGLHSGAPLVQQHSTRLPNSGLGLNLLVLLTLALAFVSSNTRWRNQLASAIGSVRLG